MRVSMQIFHFLCFCTKFPYKPSTLKVLTRGDPSVSVPRFEEPFDKFLHFARLGLRPRNLAKCKKLSNGSSKRETDTDGSPRDNAIRIYT